MMTLKEFAVPFGVLALGLWVWLLWARPTHLLWAFVLTVLLMILLYKNEDIIHVVFEPRRVLVQMRDLKEEIFAKAEEVRKLAEQMGELTAFNMTHLWRFPPENPEAVLLEERDRLGQMLTRMGIEESKVGEIVSKITDTVTRDLATRVWNAVPQEIFRQGPAKDHNPQAVREKLTDILLKTDVSGLAEATQVYLEPLGGWTKQVRARVAELEQFRRMGKLPSTTGGLR